MNKKPFHYTASIFVYLFMWNILLDLLKDKTNLIVLFQKNVMTRFRRKNLKYLLESFIKNFILRADILFVMVEGLCLRKWKVLFHSEFLRQKFKSILNYNFQINLWFFQIKKVWYSRICTITLIINLWK